MTGHMCSKCVDDDVFRGMCLRRTIRNGMF